MKAGLTSISPRTVIEEKYEVVRLIGKGGMGAVYEAQSVESRRRVAIKVLHERYCRVPELVERFQQEAKLAASIGHDNICAVTDSGYTSAGVPYLVMPLLTGMPLGRLLKTRQRPMSEARLSNIICQALSGLSAAHDAGVIHRDLKPDNIFIINGRHRDDVVKLLDFGVSKVVSVMGWDNSIKTKEGTLIGTPAYMAPEQAKGGKFIDHRIDIYAMGVILYEIMTGRLPHEGATDKETIFKIISEPFLSPRRINPDITQEVEQVILKAMARDPAARFDNASQMKNAFRLASGSAVVVPDRATSAPTAVSRPDTPFSSAETDDPPTSPPLALEQTKRGDDLYLVPLLLTFVAVALIGLVLLVLIITEVV
jgi:eukaryotic-like serine/threonine-protein kinase